MRGWKCNAERNLENSQHSNPAAGEFSCNSPPPTPHFRCWAGSSGWHPCGELGSFSVPQHGVRSFLRDSNQRLTAVVRSFSQVVYAVKAKGRWGRAGKHQSQLPGRESGQERHRGCNLRPKPDQRCRSKGRALRTRAMACRVHTAEQARRCRRRLVIRIFPPSILPTPSRELLAAPQNDKQNMTALQLPVPTSRKHHRGRKACSCGLTNSVSSSFEFSNLSDPEISPRKRTLKRAFLEPTSNAHLDIAITHWTSATRPFGSPFGGGQMNL